MLRDYALKPGK